MDFTEIFTALESGIIDGADASGLANNVGLGLYDIAKHTNYPGFHSMPSDHLACNKGVYDKMSKSHQRILNTAMEALALRRTMGAPWMPTYSASLAIVQTKWIEALRCTQRWDTPA